MRPLTIVAIIVLLLGALIGGFFLGKQSAPPAEFAPLGPNQGALAPGKDPRDLERAAQAQAQASDQNQNLNQTAAQPPTLPALSDLPIPAADDPAAAAALTPDGSGGSPFGASKPGASGGGSQKAPPANPFNRSAPMNPESKQDGNMDKVAGAFATPDATGNDAPPIQASNPAEESRQLADQALSDSLIGTQIKLDGHAVVLGPGGSLDIDGAAAPGTWKVVDSTLHIASEDVTFTGQVADGTIAGLEGAAELPPGAGTDPNGK